MKPRRRWAIVRSRAHSGAGLIAGAIAAATATVTVTTPSTARAAAPRVEMVERVSDDACDRARAFEIGDESSEALHARRLCRLQQFERRLAAERRQELLAEQQARDARLAAWLETKQPTRVLRPVSIEGFAGTGILSYGVVATWTVLRRLELAGRFGRRQMTCANEFSNDGADCTRQGLGFNVRWFLSEKDFGPFVGAGLTLSDSHLQAATSTPEGGFALLTGNGRAHSASASAGIHLAVKGLRMSLEYVYDHIYYTGANLESISGQPPNKFMPRSEPLRGIWSDSLNQDRHGVRFQAGYAF